LSAAGDYKSSVPQIANTDALVVPHLWADVREHLSEVRQKRSTALLDRLTHCSLILKTGKDIDRFKAGSETAKKTKKESAKLSVSLTTKHK
jgi:hypothetical protein